MTLTEYQNAVARTINRDISYNGQLINFAGSLVEESGEVFGIIKKHIWHGHELDEGELVKEMGDIFWYALALSDVLGIDAEDYFSEADAFQEIVWPAARKTNIGYIQILNVMECACNVAVSTRDFVGKVDRKGYTDKVETNIYRMLYNLTALSGSCGIRVNDVLEVNIDKLRNRYPEGFSQQDSINRRC